MTLREVPVRTTVSVVKIHGEGAIPPQDHGYGDHKVE